MHPSLVQDGLWIDKLLEEEKYSHAYGNEEVDSLFPTETLGIDNSLEPDPPVRIANPSPEENMDD